MGENKEFKDKVPPLAIFAIGVIVGVIFSVGICVYALNSSTIMISMLLGGLCAILGVITYETIVEVIVLSFFIGLIIMFEMLTSSGNNTNFIDYLILPMLIGGCSGKVVGSIWDALT